jgi:hypothetical protein
MQASDVLQFIDERVLGAGRRRLSVQVGAGATRLGGARQPPARRSASPAAVPIDDVAAWKRTAVAVTAPAEARGAARLPFPPPTRALRGVLQP